MKRPVLVLVAGLLVAVAAYCGVYYSGTSSCCRPLKDSTPELSWLKQEFHLDNAEYKRIVELHTAYLSGCAERCRRIDQKNAEVARLLSATNTVTSEIEMAL